MGFVNGMVDWKRKPINKEKHGGTRASIFIHFLVVITSLTFIGNVFNMILYFTQTMHMDIGTSISTITIIIGVTFGFALVGGFFSDSYITRFTGILIFGPIQFSGYVLLALQAHIPALQPPPCNMFAPSSNCEQVHGYNAAIFYGGLYLLAFGEGCLRANLASLGGDQFDEDDPTDVYITLLVGIQENKGWNLAFTLSAGWTILGVVVVASGFSFYRNLIPTSSPLTRMLQVLVDAFRKRKLQFPENDEEIYLENNKEDNVGEFLQHTVWRDKASISDGKKGNWHLCSVSQVEEIKIVLRILPVFLSATICYSPVFLVQTLSVQQGTTMNTKLGAINVPPASLFVIPIFFQLVILVIYDRVFVPFARRITGFPTGITHLQRIGVGFIAAIIATFFGAVFERKRKAVAEDHGLLDSGGQVPMSVMWLSYQFFATGIVDVTSFVGLLEFFNTEVSRGMKSLGTAMFWCNFGLASLLGSFLVDLANKATRRHGALGWLDGNNLNRGYLDRFYWFLTILGVVAFMNYLFWARAISTGSTGS
ncbi:hypothetical protein MKW98_021223 [Papaver atlanticum]|uniref:Uncharacterized protein n=1 Tax=Papaver atlanticum TaxID=357466 RepID=A0AAD4XAH7_9MAGN|nr:hypothetical protein MKW98_021223 [Papaver atlanticum]